jgi:hypothetical protein
MLYDDYLEIAPQLVTESVVINGTNVPACNTKVEFSRSGMNAGAGSRTANTAEERNSDSTGEIAGSSFVGDARQVFPKLFSIVGPVW